MTVRMLVLCALTLPLVTAPISADILKSTHVLTYNVCCAYSNGGLPGFGSFDIPTFDPSLGTLKDVEYSGIFDVSLIPPPGIFDYNGWIIPEIHFGSGIGPGGNLGHMIAYIPVSGTTDGSGSDVKVSGDAVVDGNYDFMLPTTGPPATVSVGYLVETEQGNIDPCCGWYSDSTQFQLTIQYFYKPVPEPRMLGLTGLMLFAIILVVGCIRKVDRRGQRQSNTGLTRLC